MGRSRPRRRVQRAKRVADSRICDPFRSRHPIAFRRGESMFERTGFWGMIPGGHRIGRRDMKRSVCMSAESNRAAVERLYDKFNRNDLERLEEHVAPSVVLHTTLV